jgi:hypothetical protein
MSAITYVSVAHAHRFLPLRLLLGTVNTDRWRPCPGREGTQAVSKLPLLSSECAFSLLKLLFKVDCHGGPCWEGAFKTRLGCLEELTVAL